MKAKFQLMISVLTFGSLFSSGLLAQSRFTCSTPNGSSYFSNRPCSPIVYYGPIAERQQSTYTPRASDPPEYLQFLSPRCSTLSEGIRTSGTRGVSQQIVASLQKEYQRDCADEDRDARKQLAAQLGEVADAKKSAKQIVALNQDQMKLKQTQCEESKRIIYLKKKRTDLSDGEQQDLQRFILNYKQRCD